MRKKQKNRRPRLNFSFALPIPILQGAEIRVEKNFSSNPKFHAELAVNAIEGLAQARKSVRCRR
jgi:hypothetical protein